MGGWMKGWLMEEMERCQGARGKDWYFNIQWMCGWQTSSFHTEVVQMRFLMDFLLLKWICSNNLVEPCGYSFLTLCKSFIWCHSWWAKKSRWNESPSFSILPFSEIPSFSPSLWWELKVQNWKLCAWRVPGSTYRVEIVSNWQSKNVGVI